MKPSSSRINPRHLQSALGVRQKRHAGSAFIPQRRPVTPSRPVVLVGPPTIIAAAARAFLHPLKPTAGHTPSRLASPVTGTRGVGKSKMIDWIIDSTPLDVRIDSNSRRVEPTILQVVVDPFTRRIVSWSFGNRRETTTGGQL